MPGTWLRYELIERRFGVRFREVIEMAPLMFALLAEQSLAWRREQLGKLEDALDAASKLADADRLRFVWRIDETRDELSLEGDAIFGRKLFRDPMEDVEDFYYIEPREAVNPFADYLRHLAAKIEDERVSVGDDALIPKVPRYSVYEDDLRHIAGGSQLAQRALEFGEVTIADIPDELLAEDAPEERAAWIESRVSEDFRSLFRPYPRGEEAQR